MCTIRGAMGDSSGASGGQYSCWIEHFKLGTLGSRKSSLFQFPILDLVLGQMTFLMA